MTALDKMLWPGTPVSMLGLRKSLTHNKLKSITVYFSVGTTMPRMIVRWVKRKMTRVGRLAMMIEA